MSAAAPPKRGFGPATGVDAKAPASESDLVTVALAAVQHAESTLEKGDFDTASVLAKQAVALARQGDDQHLIGWALLILGRAQGNAGHDELLAYGNVLEAYSLLGASGDITRQLWALNACAVRLNTCGDRARAIELLHKGLASAHGPDRSAIRCLLLTNLGLFLSREAEHAEALACYAEASMLARQSPQRRGQWVHAATEKARVHLQYANHLLSEGLHDEHRAQLDAAVAALAPLDCRAWRSFSLLEFNCLRPRVQVLAGLGRWVEARQAAAAGLGFGRRHGSGRAALAYGCSAVALLYAARGQLSRATRFEIRALGAFSAAGDVQEAGACLRRLAQLHAQTGDYNRALAYRKELKALISQQNRQSNALRSRLAAIERQAERQRYRANEALVHTQRLAVIGRLIAQTHHALSAPAERVLALARKAQALSGGGAVLAEVKPVLDEISRTIDQAGALVSQLKLFSYRSTPQPMALSLREALRSAWQGLAPHLGAGARLAQLEVQDDAQHLQAWGDAQRLGIMLKLLLIELTQQAAAHDEPVMIRAYIESGGTAGVVLHLQAPRRAGTPLPDAQPTQTPAPALATLGVTLCQEIAGEMGGALDVQTQLQTRAGALLRYQLRLPSASAQVHDLPSRMY
jgi:tetratricopeptide (TPR) repeat protein